jgi:hypothetical protein
LDRLRSNLDDMGKAPNSTLDAKTGKEHAEAVVRACDALRKWARSDAPELSPEIADQLRKFLPAQVFCLIICSARRLTLEPTIGPSYAGDIQRKRRQGYGGLPFTSVWRACSPTFSLPTQPIHHPLPTHPPCMSVCA